MNISPERKAWLDSLKEGDRVAFNRKRSGASKDLWRIDTIKKRTNKGRLRLTDTNGGQLLNEEGAWHDTYSYHRIQPLTDEIERILEQERIINLIFNTDWYKQPHDILRLVEGLILFGGDAVGQKTED